MYIPGLLAFQLSSQHQQAAAKEAQPPAKKANPVKVENPIPDPKCKQIVYGFRFCGGFAAMPLIGKVSRVNPAGRRSTANKENEPAGLNSSEGKAVPNTAHNANGKSKGEATVSAKAAEVLANRSP